MPTNDAVVANNVRIAAVSVSLYELIITLPAEYRFYRTFYRNNFRLSASLVLFVLNRYLNILVGVFANWEFYAHTFTAESCHRLFLVPTVFRVFLCMVSQTIMGLRAYSISRKNTTVGVVLLCAFIFTTAVQWFAQIYHRVPVLINGTCGAVTLHPTLFLSSWLFYLAGMLYDLLILIISMTYLYKLQSNSPFTSRFVKMMIYEGLGYFVLQTLANTTNVILYRTTNSLLQVAGAPLSGIVTWIMSQRILIHLYNANEKRVHIVPTVTAPSNAHRSSLGRSLSDRGRSSAEDLCDHVEKQEGTDLVSVRVDRSVVVGVGPWKTKPSDERAEPHRKPEVKWDRGLD